MLAAKGLLAGGIKKKEDPNESSAFVRSLDRHLTRCPANYAALARTFYDC